MAVMKCPHCGHSVEHVKGKLSTPDESAMESNIMPGGNAMLNHNQNGRDHTLNFSKTEGTQPKHLAPKQVKELIGKYLKTSGQIK